MKACAARLLKALDVIQYRANVVPPRSCLDRRRHENVFTEDVLVHLHIGGFKGLKAFCLAMLHGIS